MTDHISPPAPSRSAARLLALKPAWPLLVFVIVAGFLALRLPLWRDEGFTLHTTSSGFLIAIRRALFFEHQPPLYFMTLALWRQLDASPAFARLLGALIASLGAGALWLTLRRTHPSPFAAALVALAVCLHPRYLWSASELRPAAIALPVGVIQMAVWLHAIVGPPASRRTRLALVASSVALPYIQYYGALVLAAQAVATLVFVRDRARTMYVSGALVLALLLPLASLIPGQAAAHRALVPANWPDISAVLNTLDEALLYDLMAAKAEHPLLARWGVRAINAAAPLLIAWNAWVARRRHEETGPTRCATLATIVCGALFVALTGLVAPEALDTRHLSPLIALALVTISLHITVAAARWRWTGLPLALAMIMMSVAAYHYRSLSKLGSFDRVASLLRAYPAPTLLTFPNEDEFALRYTLGATAHVIGVPRPAEREVWTPGNFAIAGEEELRRLWCQLDVSDTSSLWVISQRIDGYYEIPTRRSLFTDWLRMNAVTVEHHELGHTYTLARIDPRFAACSAYGGP